jgi:CubicO group peptidase (beta-lactamase class C family)
MELEIGVAEQVGMSSQRIRRVADNIQRWVTEGHERATVALVARKGTIVLRAAAGRMGSEPDSPPAGFDSEFLLCSLMKPIVATAAMTLVEEGALDIHFPVAYFVPEFTGEGKGSVTVFHLMTHTSGLRDKDVDAHAKTAQDRNESTPADGSTDPGAVYLAPRLSTPLWKPPGQEMAYANFNFALLGEVIRRVSGMPLPDFAKARLFSPLGMGHTYMSCRDFCKYHSPPPDPVSGVVAKNPCPGWSTFSATNDLAAFAQMLLDKGRCGETRILAPLTVAAMTRNQIPGVRARYGAEIFQEAGWGLGWSVVGSKTCEASGEPLLSSDTFCHGGAGGKHLWVDPVHQLVAVYLAEANERIPGKSLGDCGGLFINSVMAAIEE